MAQSSPAYRRILLKLSGEALLGDQQYGIDPAVIRRVATEIAEVLGLGVQVGLVIGGGNIFRGAGLAEAGMDRVTADHMGMLATVINALAMQDALERLGCVARVMSALQIHEVCEDYIRRRAIRHLEKGRVDDLRGRHRQSVLHDRHGGELARDRNRRRRADQGDQGRRRLLRRSDEGSDRRPLSRFVVRSSAERISSA